MNAEMLENNAQYDDVQGGIVPNLMDTSTGTNVREVKFTSGHPEARLRLDRLPNSEEPKDGPARQVPFYPSIEVSNKLLDSLTMTAPTVNTADD